MLIAHDLCSTFYLTHTGVIGCMHLTASLGTMVMGDSKFDVEGVIMPAFPNFVNSFLNQASCQSGSVYSFLSKGLMSSFQCKHHLYPVIFNVSWVFSEDISIIFTRFMELIFCLGFNCSICQFDLSMASYFCG